MKMFSASAAFLLLASAAIAQQDASRASPETVDTSSTLDAVKVDPKHYTVDFENDRVRVVRIHYGPHEKSPMHKHPPNSVGIYLTDFNARVTLADGTSREVHATAGGTIWRAPAVTHISENLSDQPMEALWVEVKTPSGPTLVDQEQLSLSQGTAQDNTENTIRELGKQATKALLEGNIEAISKLWADDFVGIGPTGRTQTKAELIEGHRQRLLKLESTEAIEPPQNPHVQQRYCAGYDSRTLKGKIRRQGHKRRVSRIVGVGQKK